MYPCLPSVSALQRGPAASSDTHTDGLRSFRVFPTTYSFANELHDEVGWQKGKAPEAWMW